MNLHADDFPAWLPFDILISFRVTLSEKSIRGLQAYGLELIVPFICGCLLCNVLLVGVTEKGKTRRRFVMADVIKRRATRLHMILSTLPTPASERIRPWRESFP
jgi:hypothetical protein